MDGIPWLFAPVPAFVGLWRRMQLPWFGLVAALSIASLWIGWLWLVALVIAAALPAIDRGRSRTSIAIVTIVVVLSAAFVPVFAASDLAWADRGHLGWHYRKETLTVKSPVWPNPLEFRQMLGAHWETVKAGTSGCVTSALYTCIRKLIWDRDYDNGLWKLDHWFTPRDGRGVCSKYPGCNYIQRTQGAEWNVCGSWQGIPGCSSGNAYTRVRVYTDGSSEIDGWCEGFPWGGDERGCPGDVA